MGTLYVVATPIGNLEDITLRALRVLREVQLIAAEDTRRTARLLQHYSINTRTTSLHEHNERQKTDTLLDRLRAGDDIALVSDAGTPSVSDPGHQLVRAAREAKISVVPIPGANAALTALAGSGASAEAFWFLGFPPRKSIALEKWVHEHLARPTTTVVFYEAPHRVRLCLAAMLRILAGRPIIIGRELTKIHEELVEQPISEHLARLTAPKGEFTIVVPIAQAKTEPQRMLSAPEIAVEFGRMTNNGAGSPREAARQIAKRHNVPVNAVYRILKATKT